MEYIQDQVLTHTWFVSTIGATTKNWERYISNFKIFLKATEVAGIHIQPEVADTPCVACIKAKNLLLLVGGTEVKTV